jgi:hypothetical protein
MLFATVIRILLSASTAGAVVIPSQPAAADGGGGHRLVAARESCEPGSFRCGREPAKVPNPDGIEVCNAAGKWQHTVFCGRWGCCEVVGGNPYCLC